ncbi:retrovirus-related pol polyprotein from transposon TNT 1-94 [Tanacetum coccineum]|uniref:Retrovirus-related pol polyprotein from transposon TNT 1-94 n=1 Tax=Tanacetum coccineum TaxID=301880 RepID=A0ABQ5EY90_9ASTR
MRGYELTLTVQGNLIDGKSILARSVDLQCGRYWRGFGYEKVTRRCLEALELKGGDGGAFKELGWLLGDVMVMQEMCLRFLRTKDEAPEAIIKCIKNIQVRLNATVRNVRTNNGTKFVNQTLHESYENVGISHQTSVARTPQQNGIVERQNQTLIEAAHTMLIFSKVPLFL